MEPWRLVTFRLPPEAVELLDALAPLHLEHTIDDRPSRSAVILDGLLSTADCHTEPEVVALQLRLVEALRSRAAGHHPD